jgi:hypothetical protein
MRVAAKGWLPGVTWWTLPVTATQQTRTAMAHGPLTTPRRPLALAVPLPRQDEGEAPTPHALIAAARAHEEAAAVLAERAPGSAQRHRAIARLLRVEADVVRLPD